MCAIDSSANSINKCTLPLPCAPDIIMKLFANLGTDQRFAHHNCKYGMNYDLNICIYLHSKNNYRFNGQEIAIDYIRTYAISECYYAAPIELDVFAAQFILP